MTIKTIKCIRLNDRMEYSSEVVVTYDLSEKPEAISCNHFDKETYKCILDDCPQDCVYATLKPFSNEKSNINRIN